MHRRILLKNMAALGFGLTPVIRSVAGKQHCTEILVGQLAGAAPKKPLAIYNNWSAYDELSDNIPLTEELAMKELNELVRLKESGVRVDYYMMDAFWFDQAGGYRTWHKERWPDGPEGWLNACAKNDIRPGMWFSTNDRIASGDGFFLDLIPEWKDSATTTPSALCLFKGGYLAHLSDTLQFWYDKGVRAFKFDFARFGAADEATQKNYPEAVIEEKNKVAFIEALSRFRTKNEDVLIIGYNGFGGDIRDTYTPFRKTVEHGWLKVFDTLYCGDPRFSDVPMSNIWRSQDLYSDHMVRQYAFNGLPFNRIDNCGFMVGVTGTCYKRGLSAWKGMHILQYARGGWVNVFHGNLELFSTEDAGWFARVQSMYMDLQQNAKPSMFGAIPGTGKPYGFVANGAKGKVCTIVNPSQTFSEIVLPVGQNKKHALLYADGGYIPLVKGATIILGPEQLAVIGFDSYADQKFQFGTDDTIKIPVAINKVKTGFENNGHNTIKASLKTTATDSYRIFVQQFGDDNFPHRSSGGAPPKGEPMDSIIRIHVEQHGKPVIVSKQYDKMIWSGLSWGAVEIAAGSFVAGDPLEITCTSTEKKKLRLEGHIYACRY